MGWQLRHNSGTVTPRKKVIDLGEFLIVGINRSYQNLSDERLEYLNKELRDGRPVIVATHVPFYSEEDAESLEARSMEIRNRIYYWNKTDSVYSPDENTQKFIDEMYAPGSNVVQILAAHLHASWDGKATKKWGAYFCPRIQRKHWNYTCDRSEGTGNRNR